MNYYNEIKNKLLDNEIYAKVKDYSKERHKVLTYFETGKLLAEAGKVYGEDIIGQYSKKLVVEVGKTYTPRTLRRIRQFYLYFKDKKWSTLSTILSWSHYSELLTIKDRNKRLYYLNVAIEQNVTVRKLREKIKSNEYERLPKDTKEKLNNQKSDNNILDYVKNPILIKNQHHYDAVSEKALQRLIMEDLPSFLEELGTGFSFIKNEYKIKLGDNYNYIDLLLYNIKFKCYVVIELKITKVKKEHIGQIQTYMNYIDKNLKTVEEDKTIGIIIVKQDDSYIMEYCSDKRIVAREYEMI